jgi:hypothetical protein
MTSKGRPAGGHNAGDASDRVTVSARVPASEALAYSTRARELGLTVSEWLRTLARKDCGLWVGEERRDEP